MTIQQIREIIAAYVLEHRFTHAEQRVAIVTFLVRDNLVLRVDGFPEADGRQPSVAETLNVAALHAAIKNKNTTIGDHVHGIVADLIEALHRVRATRGQSHAENTEGEQLSSAGPGAEPEGLGGVDGKPAAGTARRRRRKGAAAGGQEPDGSGEAAGDGAEAEPEGPPGLDGWEESGQPGPTA